MKKYYFLVGIEMLILSYVIGWLMLLKPLFHCVLAFNFNTLTLLMLLLAATKMILAAPVGMALAWIISIIYECIVEIICSNHVKRLNQNLKRKSKKKN